MAHQRLGILGGGQLAMYLCSEARRLGITTTVMTPTEDCPAAASAGRLLLGELDDEALIDALIADSDVITFDLEQISGPALKYLASREALGDMAVHPKPVDMLLLTDKLLQKQWLQRNGLPTLPFQASDLDTPAEQAADWFGLPFVQKVRRGGYDGRGVQVIRDAHELAGYWPTPSLVEPCLPQPREFSMVAARDTRGEIAAYELVELEFCLQRNVLKTVTAPANVSPRLHTEAREIVERALAGMQGAGVFAFEFFLTENESLLINEISPRVHNSGHHTLESCQTSQFEQHVRASCGLQLGSTRQQAPAAVMHNLLAADQPPVDAAAEPTCAMQSREGIFVHWYGKRHASPGRKMGHLTAIGSDPAEARRRADRALHSLAAGGAVA